MLLVRTMLIALPISSAINPKPAAAEPCFPQTPLSVTATPTVIDSISISQHTAGPVILASAHESGSGFGGNGIFAWRFPDYELIEILNPLEGTCCDDFFIKLRIGDIDQDGNDEVVAQRFDEYELYIVENGNMQFSIDSIAFELADLNLDGDVDIVSVSSQGELWWFDNSVWTMISSEIDAGNFYNPVFVVDYNGDGHSDVVFGRSIYIGTGNPFAQFIKRELIPDGKLTPADFDNDGDIDFSVTKPNISWLQNNGGSTPSFTTHTIAPTAATNLKMGDINGDGLPDITTGSRDWYVNNGGPTPGFDFITIDLVAGGISLAGIADLNDDSFTDFVGVGNGGSSITILENASVKNITTSQLFTSLSEAIDAGVSGNTLLASPHAFNSLCEPILDFQGKAIIVESASYIERSPDTQTILAHGSGLDAMAGSLTISGTLTVPPASIATLTSGAGSKIAGPIEIASGSELLVVGELEFTPGGSLSFDRHDVLGASASTSRILIGDLDGDGDLDVLQDQSWWQNENAAASLVLSAQSIPGGVRALADLDNDGDDDLLVDFGWYRNQPSSPDPFSEFFPWPEGDNSFRFERAGDFNNDNSIDLLMTGYSKKFGNETEFLLQNNGASDPEFSVHEVGHGAHSNLISHSLSVATGDFSGDGFLDYAIAYSGNDAFYGYTVYQRINDAAALPSFSGSVLVNDVNEERFGLVAGADIDGDGTSEVVYATNDGVLFVFGSETINWPTGGSPIQVQGGDLDNDSIDEILMLDSSGNLVAYRSLGQGVGLLGRTDLNQNIERFALADLDNDGDTDIVISDNSGLAWLENISSNVRDLKAQDSSIFAFGLVQIHSVDFELGGDSTLESTASIEIDQGSSVFGSGFLAAPVIRSSGTIAPSLGSQIQINGDYEQSIEAESITRTGRMTIDLGDGAAHAVVHISGQAKLGGALLVNSNQSFNPDIGTEFLVLSAGTPIGTERFDIAFLPGLPDGKFLRPVYDSAELGNSSTERGGGGSVVLVVDELDETSFGEPTSFDPNGIPNNATLGDLNGDGFDDLVMTIPDEFDPANNPGQLLILINAQTSEPPNAWPGFTGGVISITTGPNPSDVAIGELDGLLGNDLAVTVSSSNGIETYLNDGTGGFVSGPLFAFAVSPTSVALGDVDGDGILDVAVSGGEIGMPGEVGVRLNLGSSNLAWDGLGGLSQFAVGELPVDILFRDLDEEKDLDLVSANFGDDSLSILENQGSSKDGTWNSFAASVSLDVGRGPVSVFARDLDDEKDLDLLSINNTDGTISFLLQNNTGAQSIGDSFGPSADIPIGAVPTSAAIWDPDADGDPDFAVVVNDEGGERVVRLFRNLSVENASAGTPGLSFVIDTDLAVNQGPLLVRSGVLNDNEGLDLAVIVNPALSRDSMFGPGPLPPVGLVFVNPESFCRADISGDGSLNFFDVSAFLEAYGAQDPVADFLEDGVYNFFDVSEFLIEYGQGCP